MQAKSVVVFPEPVGPTATTAPNGWETASERSARPRGDIPRSLSDDGASPCERILSVIFSPYADGSTAILTSSDSSPRRIATRPSWGMRRSAMSRPPMIFKRAATTPACVPGIEESSRSTPSTLIRT